MLFHHLIFRLIHSFFEFVISSKLKGKQYLRLLAPVTQADDATFAIELIASLDRTIFSQLINILNEPFNMKEESKM